jgi:peptidoglycan/LPS O-acetylase OafA/YrhL
MEKVTFFERITAEDKVVTNPKQSDNSLRVLGWLAIVLGISVVAVGTSIYRQDWFQSISASATYYGTAYILPFVLGGMSVYFWGYRGYAQIDRIFAKIMAVGAFITAVFPCKTPYNEGEAQIGLLGLSPDVSGILHGIGALLLFLFLASWIFFLFTKTGKKTIKPRKKLRNRVFVAAALVMFAGINFCIAGFVFYMLDLFDPQSSFPFVFWGELIILIPAGFAILVKAGDVPWLNDK